MLILGTLPGVLPAYAFWWGIASFLPLGCFPGPLELGDVVAENVSRPEGGDEVVELSLLAVGEGRVAGVAVAVAVAVGLAEGLAHGAKKAGSLLALHRAFF